MTSNIQRVVATSAFAVFCLIVLSLGSGSVYRTGVAAQKVSPTPTPGPPPIAEPQFDQSAALAKLREQIKGREQEPASKVFKNIRLETVKGMPAARLLTMMEMGYSRSLGVTCTHCHVPEKWESDESPNKGIARDMVAMTARINTELLKGVKNLSQNPMVNCTTCHRGQTKPALNLQPRS